MTDIHFPDNPRESADYPLLTNHIRDLRFGDVMLMDASRPEGHAIQHVMFHVVCTDNAIALRKALLKFAKEWQPDA